MNRALILLLLLVNVPLVSAESSEREAYIRSHYRKFEYRIPMRDGVKLFTAVYSPYDQSQTFPILMMRTPYSVAPYGADQYKNWLGPTEAFEKEGFIFVFQDVRGTFMSEGEFVNMRPHNADKKTATDIDESTDTWDTIEWLLHNLDGHNGNVGQWGISYPGFYTAAGMIDSHPALKAVSPQAPIADWFWDDMHHHGAFTLAMSFNFFANFGKPRDGLRSEWPKEFEFGTPDGYQFYLDLGPLKNADTRYFKGDIAFWKQIVEHPNYDTYWQERNLLPHLKNIKAAVMTVGGWFDMEDLYGPLKIYRSVEKNNQGTFNIIVMGPWSHGSWGAKEMSRLGDMEFGLNTSAWFQDNCLLPFFKQFLKGDKNIKLPEARVFETGANRWREFNQWPPKEAQPTSLYLNDGFKLTLTKPAAADSASDDFVSDLKKPVPYTREITTDWNAEYMTEDQRFAGRRPDVLAYTSEPLPEDLTLAGPLRAELFVSTTGTDADWVVKLIDVHPDDADQQPAAQLLVRGEIFRGRFRKSYEFPTPFTAGAITPISFELLDILHTFKRGHRLMIQIQSTWFPLFDRNPQSYIPNIFEADESDFIKTTHRVYRSAEFPSRVTTGVIK